MIELSGKYYDGRSTTPHDVVVRLQSGDVLQVEGLDPPRSFALRDVDISPRLGDTVRSLRFPDGSSCETTDQRAADALARHAGSSGLSALVHRLEASWRWALGALAFVVVFGVVGFKWGTPWLSRHVAMNVPDEMAYDLGRGTLATLDEMLFSPSQLSEDRRAELQRQFDRMAASYPELPLHLKFRHAGMPNAFALPDGTVVVTDELVELSEQDEEIWSVLAHEVGHVHHRHALRMALETSSIALLASVVFGDATQIVAVASALPGIYANAHYSRSHETEADAFALEYMEKSGIARRHFANVLRRLQKQFGGAEQEGALSYLSSHPPTAERVQRFEE